MAQQLLTGGNGTSGQTGLQTRTAINENFTEIYGGQADYVIERISTTTYARPRRSGLTAYSGSNSTTVIQNAINALTPAGAVGSSGGKIFIKTGTYSLTDELTITGWEGGSPPYSELIIEGQGNSTFISQATSSKHAIVIKNAACVSLYNFRVGCGASSRCCIFGDNSGANSEVSVYRSRWDKLYLGSNSTTHAALHLKNFFDLSVGWMSCDNPDNSGFIMENDSTTTNYGNSHFDFLRLVAKDTSPNGGLIVKSVNSTKFINLCSFGNVQVDGGGYYGIATDYAREFSFTRVGMENVEKPIALGVLGTTTANLTLGFTFSGGYVLPNTGGTSIHCSAYTGANKFLNVWIEGDATSIPILDEQQFLNPNSYDVNLGWDVDPDNIDITEAALTYLRYTRNNGYDTHTHLPTNTIHQQLNVAAMNAAPANASDTGTLGEIRITTTHIYVCTATNTWKRVAIATW